MLHTFTQSSVLAEMIHELSTSMAAMRQQMRQASVSPVRPSLKRPFEVTSSSSRAVAGATSAPSPSSPNSSSDESPHERLSPSKRKDSKLERVNPAWTWTPEMQAKVPWMSKFISGPRDPESNPHSVFCHVCNISISIKGKGHHDIVRHWRREKHFRKEQRYRDQHGMVVLDRKKNILTGRRLERERELFDHSEDFEIGVRFPFYNVRGKLRD